MGWFSADEIVAPTSSNSSGSDHNVAQTAALCVLAGVALGYILIRAVLKAHKRRTEQIAERAVRLPNLPA